jgi:hypothetical protein
MAEFLRLTSWHLGCLIQNRLFGVSCWYDVGGALMTLYALYIRTIQ